VISIVSSAIFILILEFILLIEWIKSKSTCYLWARLLSICLLPWSALVLILTGGLLFFHFFLIFRGQTTSEYLRGIPKQSIQTDENTKYCHFFERIFMKYSKIPATLLLPMWRSEEYLNQS
jgi:hypothetical protein